MVNRRTRAGYKSAVYCELGSVRVDEEVGGVVMEVRDELLVFYSGLGFRDPCGGVLDGEAADYVCIELRTPPRGGC